VTRYNERTEELVEVLWAYRCTPQTSTQETPYSLTYGTEEMIPVEVSEPSLKRQLFDLYLNQESLSVELDLLNKLRDKSKILRSRMHAPRSQAVQLESPTKIFSEGRRRLEDAK